MDKASRYDCKLQMEIKNGLVTAGFKGSTGALAMGVGAMASEIVAKTEMTGTELLGVVAIMLGEPPFSQREGSVTIDLSGMVDKL